MLEIAPRHLDCLAGADVRTRGCVLMTGFLRFQVRGVNFHAFYRSETPGERAEKIHSCETHLLAPDETLGKGKISVAAGKKCVNGIPRRLCLSTTTNTGNTRSV